MSYLYHPLKALGLYSSNVPLNIKSVGENDYYLFSAVGCYFLVYRFSNLALIGTSDRLDENIISITGYKNNFFCGCESRIYGFTRAKHVSKYYEYEGERNWRIVQVFGEEGTLCGVNECNRLVMWNIESGDVFNTFLFPSEKEEFIVQSVMQPKGYENKILVAGTKGKMHLLNYKNNNLLYAFDLAVEISVVVQSPDNDTVAIGCLDGSVLLHNLRFDKTLVKLNQDLGAIVSIGWKTDGEDELVMLTGTNNGHIALWALDKMRSTGQARHCHDGPVLSLFCVPGKPLLVTNGPDNSIKVWNFDRPDGTPQLLRSRSGHWLPPTRIAYWPRGALSTEIVSAGADSCLNVFNAYEERQNFSMGRAYLPHHGAKREDRITREQYLLPPCSSLAVCSARDGFWDSVALCHEGHRQVSTWTFSKRCRGKHYLDLSTFAKRDHKYKRVVATRCALSSCGNFVVIGYSSGHVGKFNIQSGIERGQFSQEDSKEGSAHDGAISALVIGHTESAMVLVTGASRSLLLWEFKKRQSINSLRLNSEILDATLHPSCDVVALSMQDGIVNLVQLARFVVFQQVRASSSGEPISSIAFAHEADNLMVVASGKLVKTFDYINNKLVDCFRVRNSVTQVVMAPNDAYLVTAHAGDVGLYLWSMKLHLYTIKLAGLPIDYQPDETLDAPKMYCGDDEDDNANVDKTDLNRITMATETDVEMSEPIQFGSEQFAKFSGLPASFFANLSNLENIRIRNENVSIGLASTQFFIPQITETLEGLRWIEEDPDENCRNNGNQQGNKGNKGEEDNKHNKLIRMKHNEHKRKISELKASEIVLDDNIAGLLETARTSSDYDRCAVLLAGLSPTAIDNLIENLDPLLNANNSYRPMCAFLGLLVNQLERARSVELCQVCLAVLLKHNIDRLVEEPATRTDTDSDIPIHEFFQSRVPPHSDGEENLYEIFETELSKQPDDNRDNDGNVCDRQGALRIVSRCVVAMKKCCRSLNRQLNQIIEMAQFSYNSL